MTMLVGRKKIVRTVARAVPYESLSTSTASSGEQRGRLKGGTEPRVPVSRWNTASSAGDPPGSLTTWVCVWGDEHTQVQRVRREAVFMDFAILGLDSSVSRLINSLPNLGRNVNRGGFG